MEKVFHMNGGIDHVSYAKNSFLQKMAGDTMKHITLEMVRELYLLYTPNSLGIADLGCSSGHNSLSMIKEMVGTIEKASHDISKPMPEIKVYLNDLPTNDFNMIFMNLPEFYKDLQKIKNSETTSIYIGAYPGSFYGRLFPNMSLHFVYAAFSLHWLSKVPRDLYDDQGRSVNKASMYIAESSPPQVSKAYYRQFQEDMTMFLKSRAEEVVGGGKMVLLLLGRIGANYIDRGNYILWELLTRSFVILVSQGEIEEEKFESYNTHFYAPSKEEFQEEVRKEGSFETERLDMFEIDRNIPDGMSYGKVVASAVRAIQETAIRHHFGDKIIDNLFDHYARLLDEETSKTKTCEIALVVVLSKKI